MFRHSDKRVISRQLDTPQAKNEREDPGGKIAQLQRRADASVPVQILSDLESGRHAEHVSRLTAADYSPIQRELAGWTPQGDSPPADVRTYIVSVRGGVVGSVYDTNGRIRSPHPESPMYDSTEGDGTMHRFQVNTEQAQKALGKNWNTQASEILKDLASDVAPPALATRLDTPHGLTVFDPEGDNVVDDALALWNFARFAMGDTTFDSQMHRSRGVAMRLDLTNAQSLLLDNALAASNNLAQGASAAQKNSAFLQHLQEHDPGLAQIFQNQI